MSAFMVKADSINRIVTFLQILENKERCTTRRGLLTYLDPPFSFRNANGEVSQTKMNKLAKQIFDMNAEAVNYRYAGRDDMIPERTGFELLDMDAENESLVAQVLKNIDCLLYQCSEGNVPEKDLYKKLEDFSVTLTHAIAVNTPEYERAEWG